MKTKLQMTSTVPRARSTLKIAVKCGHIGSGVTDSKAAGTDDGQVTYGDTPRLGISSA